MWSPPPAAVGQALTPYQVLQQALENGQRVIEALKKYQCVQDAKVQPVKPDFIFAGTYHRVSRLYHDRTGGDAETVVEQKSDVSGDYRISGAFLERLARFYYFLMGAASTESYDFNYVGQERVDELNTYVFDVRPKAHKLAAKAGGVRYLKGRIWIDGQDLQVVKVAGEIAPAPGLHRTPRFETYFQNFGKYWFPTYSWADDDLFDGDEVFRAIIVIRYSEYKREG
ncbi:MAG: hypothetical protein ACREDR_00965 [Blastocatellia bacterium]